MDNPVTMLTIKEVPEHFSGTTEHMIRQLVVTKQIPSVLVGKKKCLICAEILSEYLRRGNNTPEPEQTGKIRRLV